MSSIVSRRPPSFGVDEPVERTALDVDQVGDINGLVQARETTARPESICSSQEMTPSEGDTRAEEGAEARQEKIAQGSATPEGPPALTDPAPTFAYVARRRTSDGCGYRPAGALLPENGTFVGKFGCTDAGGRGAPERTASPRAGAALSPTPARRPSSAASGASAPITCSISSSSSTPSACGPVRDVVAADRGGEARLLELLAHRPRGHARPALRGARSAHASTNPESSSTAASASSISLSRDTPM